MRATTYLRILGFVALITLPLARSHWGGGALTDEKRDRAPLPRLSLATLRTYPEKFDAYFRDRFGFREELIHWHSVLAIKHLRESPVPNVIVGGSGRLFYAGYNDGVDIKDFAGNYPIRSSDVDAYLAHLLARRDQYAARGARFVVVLVPNKQTVYPEDVPARFGPHRPGLFDAVVARLRSRPDLDVIDLRPVLRAHRDEPVFYNTDTHWNLNGAFWASQALVDYLRRWYPALEPFERDHYRVTRRDGYAGDMVHMLSLPDTFDDATWEYARRAPLHKRVLEEGLLHRVYERADARLPRVVLLGDSFGINWSPLLSDAFARLHYYYAARAGYDARLVEAEKPDVVILEVVERYLPNLASQ
jgi:alginate O-acetyltransferase complex protein AlgJ